MVANTYNKGVFKLELEKSNFNTERIEVEPRILLCINCKRGGGDILCYKIINELIERIKNNPELHITMKGAFDEVGARTELFYKQTPAERKKDLDVLQRLGLCFGDTRTARDLFLRISKNIPSLKGICEYYPNEYGTWKECSLARKDYYIKGNKPLPNAQSPEIMAKYKESSCKAIEESNNIVIRAHHLLCIICYAGRENNDVPLPEDNLLEAWVKFRENPDIPVTIVEGPQLCCICPPCHGFVQDRGLCVAACHLRDRKKDLDFCVAVGITPGETYTARELYRRIGKKLKDNKIVCGYDVDTSPEWTSCGGTGSEVYRRGFEICTKGIGGL